MRTLLKRIRNIYWWLRNHEVRYPQDYLLLVIAPVFVILIRVLRPWVTIRLIGLTSSRIGEQAFEVDGYLAEKELGLVPSSVVDIFFYSSKIANKFVSQKWKKKIRVWNFARHVHLINQLLPGCSYYTCDVSTPSRAGRYRELLKTKCHLVLSDSDNRRAQKILLQKGYSIPDNFVCFFNRDSAYLNSHIKNQSWHYHDYRDSNIENYRLAIESLAKQGYEAIRMGVVFAHEFKSTLPNVIDYSKHLRGNDDILDVYLINRSRFVIGTSNGLVSLCLVLRKNIVTVNASPFITMLGLVGKQDLFIPKLYWSVANARPMTLREILRSPARNINSSQEFSDAGIELRENTSDEILSVVLEMEQKLTGTWVVSDEETMLHRSYSKILSDYGLDAAEMPRIGSGYLRKYKEIFEL